MMYNDEGLHSFVEMPEYRRVCKDIDIHLIKKSLGKRF